MMTMYISPYRRLNTLRDAMDRLFDETFPEKQVAEREMTLAVDVLADDDAYTVRAFVPGLDAEALNIEILNNTVAIRGQFVSENLENVKYLTSELPEGNFARIITLPMAVDATKVEATIHNGVLTLSLPKAEAHKPKSIKVNLN